MHLVVVSAQLLNDACRGDMARAGLSFRLLYRVIFFCFCVSFACFYLDGSFWYDKQEDKTDSNAKAKKFLRKPLNGEEFLEKNQSRDPTWTENVQRTGGGEAQNEPDLFSWMEKKWKKKVCRSKKRIINNSSLHKMTTTLRLIGHSLKLKSTTPPTLRLPFSFEMEVTRKRSPKKSIVSHSSETKRRNIDSKNKFNTAPLSLDNGVLHSKVLEETKHVRNRRESDTNAGSVAGSTECNKYTFNIKYNGEYRVTNDFSIIYRGQTYNYYEYRMTDDGLQILKSDDQGILERCSALISMEKRMMAMKRCNLSNHVFFWQEYVLYRDFTVFLKYTEQNFTWHEYGVIYRNLFICSSKISLSCDDFLTKVKLGASLVDQYNVWQNFSLSYNNRMFNYREYRVHNESLEMCNSTDLRIQGIWRAINTFKQSAALQRCIEIGSISRLYAVDKRFTVYLAFNGQYLTRKGNHYSVFNKTVLICLDKLRLSNEFTQEDLVMCNDSVINIQYEDNYKVRKNFSILYKDKMYDYTEYRALNDGIKICNSTDTFTLNSWNRRNKWIKNRRANKNCNTDVSSFSDQGYIVQKDLRVRISLQFLKVVIDKNDYGVTDHTFRICDEKLWFNVWFSFLKYLKPYIIALLCTSALSSICLLLLLIVYCLLPELRTMPGMNLMNLSIAYLLQNIISWAFVWLSFSNNEVKYPCVLEKLAITFTSYSVLTNIAANVHHLRRTFCANVLVKSNDTKVKSFLKYAVFSWGVPVILTAAEFIIVRTGILTFSRSSFLWCLESYRSFAWDLINTHILHGALMLYSIVTFIFTAYRIRQKLKASSNIAKKSNIIRKRQSFVLLLKLSTIAGFAWIPSKIPSILSNTTGNTLATLERYFIISTVAFIVWLLSGFYIAIAFVFTRKNYRLLRKKYFPAKDNAV